MAVEFTEKQKALADALLTTRTEAKVGRRRRNSDGSFELYSTTRPTSPIDFPVNDEEFALKLHERRIEAPLSPIYINLRNLPGGLLTQVAEAIAEIPLDERPEYCVGIPEAGYPIVGVYSYVSGIQQIRVLGKSNSAVDRQIVPIPFTTNVGEWRKILLVDDLITQADTKFEAISAAEELGFKVVGVAVLFDREQGGREQLEKAGYRLYAALRLSDALDYYLITNQITQERYNQVIDYLQ